VAERTTPGTRTALTIGASDSGGGSGIQADLKTFSAMNVYGAAVITAVTFRSGGSGTVEPLEASLVERQLDGVGSQLNAHAVKVGLLPDPAATAVLAKALKRHSMVPLVVDPVMVNKAGERLIDDLAVKALCRSLLPLAALVTPNRFEAAVLLGRSEPIEDLYGALSAAREICRSLKVAACVVMGIERPNDEEGEAVDIFYDGDESRELIGDWRPTSNTTGAGCTFSAAVTAALATGEPIDQAVQTAKRVVGEAVRQTTDLGHGYSPVNPLAYATVG